MSKFDKFPKLIALGGVAKSGKDTFGQALHAIRPGGVRISIGDIIRADCANLIKDTLGINVYNCTPEEKEIIRPILVGYGLSQRIKSKGQYFTDALSRVMSEYHNEFDVEYFIFTDLRFDEYKPDEIDWVKANGGIVVHISRYMRLPSGELEFVLPVNDTEKLNDPRIKARADYVINWESVNDSKHFQRHAQVFHDWVVKKFS